MGNYCSSGQAHKDDASHHSEESPSYHVTLKKPSTDGATTLTIQEQDTTTQGPPVAPSSLLGTQGSFRDGSRKGGLNRVFRNVASSSISDSISLSSPVAAQSPRSLDPGTGAPAARGALAALPIEAQAALLGRAADVRQRNRALVIYVCAADSQDCCQEKGSLHVGTANVLRRAARAKGWRLHVSDLHWRSPLEQQRDHRFPILCRAELARQCELAYVIPVLFLNSGLGTPLLPHSIDHADFQSALAAVGSEDDRILLNKWYKLDSGATPPCYRLARGAAARWRREMTRALAALVGALPTEARDAYLTTVVEQEVHNTVLMSQEQARRCLWVCRAGGGGSSACEESPDLVGDQELHRRLSNLQRDLKQHLSERHIVRASLRGPRGGPPGSVAGAEYVKSIREALLTHLSASLDSLVADDAGSWPRAANGVPTSLFEELNEQLTFCQKAAQCTANRDITLNEIKNYICGDSNIPLVVAGAVGSGKTCLMARTALLCNTWIPEAAVVIRFVGLTADSSNAHAILKSMVDHCSVLSTGAVYRGTNEILALKKALTSSLLSLSVGGNTVLIVAGAGRVPHMSWLPTELPNNVKLIISITQGEARSAEDAPTFLTGHGRSWATHLSAVPPTFLTGYSNHATDFDTAFTNNLDPADPTSSDLLATLSAGGARVCRSAATVTEALAALAACAALYGRSGALSPPPRAIGAVQACTQPLYAKIVAWQTSLLTETFTEQSETEIEEELKICADLPGQVEQLLFRCERALGADRVEACLALLTAARRGLDDAEMLDLLANEDIFKSEQTYLPWAPACLFWSQLAALLSPFLLWASGGRARWRDEAVRGAALSRYLRSTKSVRTKLIDYFQGVWFAVDDPKMTGRLISQENKFSDECYNRRKLEEIPYQEYHVYKDDLQTYSRRPYFTNHQQIYDTIAACGTTQLLHDLSLVKIDPLPEHVVILKKFLEDNSYALDYDVRQFYGLLRLTLEKWVAESGDLECEFCQQWLEVAQKPPIPTLIATNLFVKRIIQADMASPDEAFAPVDCSYDLVVRLKGTCRYAATVSTEREEICVWDVKRSVKVRTLTGVTHPINLVPIDKHKCVVLCRRELRVYDLNKGTFLLTLKGVMNQKMPYYGLHDAEHVVCLSRNRMYVNLMNITTGDCVTTFKAGEDRFLNSLLVSGDGRILVCGDETQKPFPLLIWSLQSRKLLYDLRIAHHDFITTLAAITHEGSYVCVVARELEEPGPNFIVVYDLQSGTLFKKWKPGCDTVSLAISAADSCVLSGLRDSRILVWDLVTGNCRHVLCGHSSGPTRLRLPCDGGVLLSSDCRRADLSVRLWDLNAGKLIAVYTPPEPITSCEVLSGGGGILIALALENRQELVTLRSEGRVYKAGTGPADNDQMFGDEDMEGAVLDLRDKIGTPGYSIQM